MPIFMYVFEMVAMENIPILIAKNLIPPAMKLLKTFIFRSSVETC